MITVVDYGMGNLRSVEKAFERLNTTVEITADPERVANAGKLILPGVGHFGRGIENLKSRGLFEAVVHAKERGAPLLGICLGMQLLTRSSEEGGTEGFGFVDSEVCQFQISGLIKIPHMGWNTLRIQREIPLLKGIDAEAGFYFAHSYHASVNTLLSEVIATTQYGYEFPCIVQHDNVIGVQFHPEKSHDAGLRLLNNFVNEY